MEAKKRLARTITAQYHGDRGAVEAEEHFARVHQQRDVPDEIETARVPASGASGRGLPPKARRGPSWLVLKEAGLVPSTSEARRMIQQGAVEVDRRRVTSTERNADAGERVPDPGGQATLQTRGPRRQLVKSLTSGGSIRIVSALSSRRTVEGIQK